MRSRRRRRRSQSCLSWLTPSPSVVSNLAHPGGNLTGLSFLNTELSAKRLELLLETLPNIRRIAVLRDLNTPRIWAEATETTEEASRRLGLSLQLLEVAEPERSRAP